MKLFRLVPSAILLAITFPAVAQTARTAQPANTPLVVDSNHPGHRRSARVAPGAQMPRTLNDYHRMIEQKRRIEIPKPSMSKLLTGMLAKPEFGTNGAISSQPFFSGADTTWGLPEITSDIIGLQRQSNCTLSQVLLGLSYQNSGSATFSAVQKIPGYELYMHNISGLTTTADQFKNGCADPGQTGISAQGGVYLGTDTSGDLVGAGYSYRSQNVLQIYTTSATAQVTYAQVPMPGDILNTIAADVNGDGRLDIVLLSQNAAGTGTQVSVLLNNGNGTFAAPVSVTTPYPATSIVAGNFTGKGHVDLVLGAANSSSPATNYLLLYTGNGSTTYANPTTTSTGTTAYTVMTAADVNGNGNLDIVGYADTPGSNGTNTRSIASLINSGTGTFTAKTSANTQSSGPIAVGDLNGDGKVDIAIADEYNSLVEVAEGDGTGNFTQVAVLPAVYSPDAIYISDMDGDGIADITLAYVGNGMYGPAFNSAEATYGQTYLGKGNFLYSTPALLTAPGLVPSGGFITADINGDGNPDLAALESPSEYDFGQPLTLATFLNSAGTLAYSKSTALSLVSPGGTLLTGALNGTDKTDLLAFGLDSTNSSPAYQVITNAGGTLTAKSVVDLPDGVAGAVLGSFSGSAYTDMAALLNTNENGSGSPGLYLLTGNGNGTFNKPTLIDANLTTGTSLATADVNGDGRPDLIAVNTPTGFGPSTVQVYLNQGGGKFASPITLTPPENANIQQALPVTYTSGGNVGLLLLGTPDEINFYVYSYTGNKTGNFTYLATSDAGQEGSGQMVYADVNHDGIGDLVLNGCCGFATAQVLLGESNGVFYPGQPFGNVLSISEVQPITLGSASYPDMVFQIPQGYAVELNHYANAPATAKAATTITTTGLNYPTIQGVAAYPTVTVAETSGQGIPTGTLTYTFNGATYTTQLVQGTAYLTLPVTTSMYGSYPVSVSYQGDQFNSPSTASGAQVVEYTTQVTLSASSQSVIQGSPITLTSDVTRPYGTGYPTGNAQLYYNGGNTVLTTVPLKNGVATFTAPTSGVPPGIYGVSSCYYGDSLDGDSCSSTVNVTVVPKGDNETATTLSISPNAAPAGVTVTAKINVTLAGSTSKPAGTVTLFLDSNAVATLPLSNGAATASEPLPADLYIGQHTVYARYNTNGKNYESASQPQTLQVQYATTTTISASSTTPTVGQQVTLTAYVESNSTTGPTGSVTFYANGTKLATVPYNSSSGTATLTAGTAGYPPGTYNVTAVYSGDQYNGGSASSPLQITLQQ